MAFSAKSFGAAVNIVNTVRSLESKRPHSKRSEFEECLPNKAGGSAARIPSRSLAVGISKLTG